MRREVLFRHAQETVAKDLEALRSAPDGLLENAKELNFGHIIEACLEHGAEGFYSSEVSPRPAVRLVHAAYEELPVRKNTSRQVTKFIGGTLIPLAQLPDRRPDQQVKLGDDDDRGCCPRAESYFHSALEQLRSRWFEGHSRLSVYHDAEGTPLLLRKKVDESTGLTLAPLALKNMVLPPGTIVTVGSAANKQQTGFIRHSQFSIHSYSADDSLELTPLRLSAWAYDDPLDRALFATYGHMSNGAGYYSPAKAVMLARTELSDFIVAADEVIEQSVV